MFHITLAAQRRLHNRLITYDCTRDFDIHESHIYLLIQSCFVLLSAAQKHGK